MGLAIEPFTANDVARAADLITLSRAHRNDTTDSCLSLSDGLCLAVTERLNLPVTGGDQLWAELPLTVQFMSFRR